MNKEAFVPTEPIGQEQDLPVPTTVDEFDALMLELGRLWRAIATLSNHRDDEVAAIDATYNANRRPLAERYAHVYASCMAFASDPVNKGRMTTATAPQTADLPHSQVKWTDDHEGQIGLTDGITDDQAIRALMRRRGGSKLVRTVRTLDWAAIRSKSNQAMVLGMRHFTKAYKPTRVALYAKPTSTPKPEGKDAATPLKPLS